MVKGKESTRGSKKAVLQVIAEALAFLAQWVVLFKGKYAFHGDAPMERERILQEAVRDLFLGR